MSIVSDIGTGCVRHMPAFAAGYSVPTEGDALTSSEELQSPLVLSLFRSLSFDGLLRCAITTLSHEAVLAYPHPN
jgi:hypothetical protein